MAEYIERGSAMRTAHILRPEDKELMSAISIIPAAEVAPVRHGKWMPFHAEFAGDIQYCSVCEIGFSDRTAYCPHCGAVMDGAE